MHVRRNDPGMPLTKLETVPTMAKMTAFRLRAVVLVSGSDNPTIHPTFG
jgi:hypothetical protein